MQKSSQVIGVALLATFVVVATAAALLLAIDFVLLAFLGLLFGVFLTKTSGLLSHRLPVSYEWNLAIVTTTLLLLCVAILILFGGKIESRLSKTSQQLDESAQRLNEWLDQYPIAASAIRQVPFAEKIGVADAELNADGEKEGEATDSDKPQSEPDSNSKQSDTDSDKPQSESDSNSKQSDTDSKTPQSKSNGSKTQSDSESSDDTKSKTDQQVRKMASSDVLKTAVGKVFGFVGKIMATTFGLAANMGVIFFIGIFVAVDPPLYRDGFARLFPPPKRTRVIEIMNLMGDSMFNWLQGRFLTMFITGAGTSVALWLLGVPMPITIGVVTGLLTFIPNIGAIIALGLATLMALSQGPMTVVWVVLVYGLLQLIESNIVTPVIQQYQTSIAPALLLTFQILMAALTGFLGVMVATPLLAAAIVLVKEVWVKDTLER